MNLATAYSVLLLAGLSVMVAGELGLAPMLLSYRSGDNAVIDYWADVDYADATMMLVHRIPEGWDSYETIFMVDSLPKGNHTFLWQVREVAQGEQYGIWLSARDKTTSSEGGVTNGFADLSNWFEIHNVAGRQIDQGSALTLSPGKLAGVAVGGFATGALVAGVVMFAFTRRRAARRESAMTPLGRRESDDSVMVEKQRLALRDKSAY